MIPASQAIIDAVAETTRSFKARFLVNGEVLEGDLTSLDIMTGGGGSVPIPGAVFSSYITATMLNLTEAIKGLDLTLQIGVVTGYENDEEVVGWLPGNGVYRVIKTAEAGNRTTFTAVGRLTSHCQGLYNSALSYPASVSQVISEISTGCGVTVTAPGFTLSPPISKKLESMSYSQALSTIASLLGGFVTEDYQGNIVIKAYGSGSTYSIDLSRFGVYPEFTEDELAIEGITCNVSERMEIEVDKTISSTSLYYSKGGTTIRNQTITADTATLPINLLEAGDAFAYLGVCEWWDWEGYPTRTEEKEEFEAEFVYGTASSEVILEINEPDDAVLTASIIYNGANTVTLQLNITYLNTYIGIQSGKAHYYREVIPEVSYTYGTPTIIIENPYMTERLFTNMRQKYVGYSFYPAMLPLTLGNPMLEPWDVVAVTDTRGDIKRVPGHLITSHFMGGFSQEISSLMEGVEDASTAEPQSVLSARIDQIANATQIAQASATAAQASASSAQQSATSAETSAAVAATMATNAIDDAARAHTAADEAEESAQEAKSSADSALLNLGMTQSVLDVVNWVAAHGRYVKATQYVEGTTYYTVTAAQVTDPTQQTDDLVGRYYELVSGIYVKTADTEYDSQKTYYNVTGTPVTAPKAEDIGQYYVLEVTDAMGDYIQTHLALTSDGLYVMGDSTKWKVLVADDGVSIIDGTSGVDKVVAQYKNFIQLGEDSSSNILISPSGMQIRDGVTDLAMFTPDGAVIGTEGAQRLEMTPFNLTAYNNDSAPFFDIDYDGGLVSSWWGTGVSVMGDFRAREWAYDSTGGIVDLTSGELDLSDRAFDDEKCYCYKFKDGSPTFTLELFAYNANYELRVIETTSTTGCRATVQTPLVNSPVVHLYVDEFEIDVTQDYSDSVSATFLMGSKSKQLDGQWTPEQRWSAHIVIFYNYTASTKTLKGKVRIARSPISGASGPTILIKTGWFGLSAGGRALTSAPSFTLGSVREAEAGGFSATIGHGCEASVEGQLATGRYNANDGNLFEIGNGTGEDNRSNAFAVNSSGKATIGTGGRIAYQSPFATHDMIRFIDSSDEYGDGISIGGDGLTIVGAGEYATARQTGLSGGSETLYLGSDGNVYIETNANTFANRKTTIFDSSGNAILAANVITTSESVDRDGANPSEVAYGQGLIMRDKDAERVGTIRVDRLTDGRMQLAIGCHNEKSDGTEASAWFCIYVAKDGAITYSLPAVANFRSAIGLGSLATKSSVGGNLGVKVVDITGKNSSAIAGPGNGTVSITFNSPANHIAVGVVDVHCDSAWVVSKGFNIDGFNIGGSNTLQTYWRNTNSSQVAANSMTVTAQVMCLQVNNLSLS